MSGDKRDVHGEWTYDSDILNHCRDDPLLDWLQLYGHLHGYNADTPDVDVKEHKEKAVSVDFAEYIAEKNTHFFRQTLTHIQQRLQRHGPFHVRGDATRRLPTPIVQILSLDRSDARKRDAPRLDKYRATRRAMQLGVPVIVYPTLHNTANQTVCVPNLLVRNDVLHWLIDRFVEPSTAPSRRACDFYYVVVLVRFATLPFKAASAELRNSGSFKYYKALVTLQSQALGAVQGYVPPHAYIIGRGWQCSSKAAGRSRCHNALSTVGVVGVGEDVNINVRKMTERALVWLRELRTSEAAREWKVVPTPSREELYPNMKNHDDQPYTGAKKRIATEIKEITLLYYCSVRRRRECHKSGIFRLDDPFLSAERAGITGPVQSRMFSALLLPHQQCVAAVCEVPIAMQVPTVAAAAAEDNHWHPMQDDDKLVSASPSQSDQTPLPTRSRRRPARPVEVGQQHHQHVTRHQTNQKKQKHSQNNSDSNSNNKKNNKRSKQVNPFELVQLSTRLPSVAPLRLKSQRYLWRIRQLLEFFVDFETATSIGDPLDQFPKSRDTTFITMIGCGWYNPAKKKFELRLFICEQLNMEEERRIIEEWIACMDAVKRECAPLMDQRPRVWHWSNAEPQFFEYNYNSAARRHAKEREWKGLINWCDMYQLFRQEPIAGPWYDLGLKSVAKGLHKLGKIHQIWPESVVDSGLNAMIALFRCSELANAKSIPMTAVPLMEELRKYLRIDVSAMHQILTYLRKHHTSVVQRHPQSS